MAAPRNAGLRCAAVFGAAFTRPATPACKDTPPVNELPGGGRTTSGASAADAVGVQHLARRPGAAALREQSRRRVGFVAALDAPQRLPAAAPVQVAAVRLGDRPAGRCAPPRRMPADATPRPGGATHPVLGGRHQLRILPEHGPGPIARNARVRYSTGGCSTEAVPLDVEIRDLACYEAAYGLGGAQ